jgi:hypothetical protein
MSSYPALRTHQRPMRSAAFVRAGAAQTRGKGGSRWHRFSLTTLINLSRSVHNAKLACLDTCGLERAKDAHQPGEGRA